MPAETYGKQYWVNTLLQGKYVSVTALNTAYGTTFADWNAVLACAALVDDASYPARHNDKLDFQESIADEYYRHATSKMRQYDPNHLVLSARWAMFWNGYGNPYNRSFNERIWKKAGQYCDIIANNGYADFGATEATYQHSSRVFQNAKKPFMITEHAYLAKDTPFVSAGWWQDTQMDRARAHTNHMNQLMDLGVTSDPNDGQAARTCMGIHYFQIYDEPSLGRMDGERNNYGLVNVKDEPYVPLVDVLATIHQQVYPRGRPGPGNRRTGGAHRCAACQRADRYHNIANVPVECGVRSNELYRLVFT